MRGKAGDESEKERRGGYKVGLSAGSRDMSVTLFLRMKGQEKIFRVLSLSVQFRC